MKVQRAIDIASLYRPNAIPEDEAIRWLNELDHQLVLELFNTHANPEGISYEEYTPENKEANLLVPSPYDKLYPSYLIAKSDETYGEENYNVSSYIFNNQMKDFNRYWKRNHVPVSATQKPETNNGGIVYVYPENNALKK